MTADLFNRITQELPYITGWCPQEKAFDLAAAVVALRPEIVVELGVWGGRSLFPMAMACEAVSKGTVYAIDPWSPAASVEGYDAPNVEWWGKQDHEGVYRAFIQKMDRLGLRQRIEVVRSKSDDVTPPKHIGLLHIDGQHTVQATRDVERYAVNVRMGGIVCMDDLGWTVDGDAKVAHAADRLLSFGFTELFRSQISDGFWGFFQKTHHARTR